MSQSTSATDTSAKAAVKNYIGGSARAVPTQYGEILNLSIKVEDLLKIQNAKWYAAVSVFKRKDTSEFGDTHYLIDNTMVVSFGHTPA